MSMAKHLPGKIYESREFKTGLLVAGIEVFILMNMVKSMSKEILRRPEFDIWYVEFFEIR